MELSMLQIKPIQEGDLPQLDKLFNNEYQHDQIDGEILYEKTFLEPSFPAEPDVRVTQDNRFLLWACKRNSGEEKQAGQNSL